MPHEALMALFKDSPTEAERAVVKRLKAYHKEIRIATGGRLRAEFSKTLLPHQLAVARRSVGL